MDGWGWGVNGWWDGWADGGCARIGWMNGCTDVWIDKLQSVQGIGSYDPRDRLVFSKGASGSALLG